MYILVSYDERKAIHVRELDCTLLTRCHASSIATKAYYFAFNIIALNSFIILLIIFGLYESARVIIKKPLFVILFYFFVHKSEKWIH